MFFTKTIQCAYEKLDFKDNFSRVALLILTILFFFVITALQVLTTGHNVITQVLTCVSVAFMPFILFFVGLKNSKNYIGRKRANVF